MFGIQDERGYNQVFKKRGTTVLRALRRNQWFADQLGDGTVKYAVEIGSGAGQTAYHVAKETGVKVLAVDLSHRFVEDAKILYPLPNLEFRQLNILEDDLPLAGRADAFFGIGILHHLIPRLDEVLERMRTLTRDGGRFAFIEPNLRHPACRVIFGTKLGRYVARLEPDEMAFLEDELTAAVSRAGWTDVAVKTQDFLLPGMPRFLASPVLALERGWGETRLANYIGQSHFISARAG